MKKHLVNITKKLAIAVLGLIVIIAGLIMVPYPGPGWLVVFAGLAILASEFSFAHDLLEFGKEKYKKWQDWVLDQGLPVQIIIWALMGIIIVLTIWLLNGYGVLVEIFNLNIPWLVSPFF